MLACWCGATPVPGRFLCLEPVPWEPTRDWFVCRRCVEAREPVAASAKALQEDAEVWQAHLDACTFCYRNRGLLPKGLLFQMCADDRRAA